MCVQFARLFICIVHCLDLDQLYQCQESAGTACHLDSSLLELGAIVVNATS